MSCHKRTREIKTKKEKREKKNYVQNFQCNWREIWQLFGGEIRTKKIILLSNEKL